MNLELPFYELPDAELDAYLDRIDQELDGLFLDAVKETVEALGAERAPARGDGTAAA